MKKITFSVLALLVAGFSALHAQGPATIEPPVAHTASPTVAPVKLPPQLPDVPAPKLVAVDTPNPGFIKAHESFVKIAQANKTGVLFLGDSITAGWGKARDIWERKFGAFEPANFGISGDRTQHVLWRITNGELDGFQPKVVVLMIGTNNMGGDTVEGIASGVTKIVETIRQKTPATRILLCAIFPRGEKPGPVRDKIKQVNAIIAKLDDGKSVHYLDFSAKFLEQDGTLSKEIMPDFLHPSPKGYQIWADAISPKLAELMK